MPKLSADLGMQIIQALRLRRMQRRGDVVLRGLGGAGLPRRALLHYKIEPLLMAHLQKDYRHTNVWECPEIVRVLNAFGYTVDVVDRSNRSWMPGDDYDLLVSNASGNSGRMYPVYAGRMPRAVKVFYGLGPEVSVANARVLERYAYLRERRGIELAAMRVMDSVDIEACRRVSDGIIVLDDNGYSSQTYRHWGLPMFSVFPSSSPRASLLPTDVAKRDRGHFLAFSGDGFIAKGMDLLFEVFAEHPDLRLTVAGSDSDEGFWKVYDPLLKKAPNIRYEGFLTVGGAHFRKLTEECAFVILPPAAEGVCTSITTCMCAGLVPIVTWESGVDVKGISDYLPTDVRKLKDGIGRALRLHSSLGIPEYRSKVAATLRKSQDYSQASFSVSWRKALAGILDATGRLC